MEAVKEHYILGRPIPKEQLFYEFAEEWYNKKKKPFLARATQNTYRSCFKKHILPEFGLRQLQSISADELQDFVSDFSGTSKSEITLVVGILKAVFRNAYAQGIIPRDPSVAIVRPKPSKVNERRALTPQERSKVLEVIDSNQEGLVLAVLYCLGVRKGEALGLKWKDFDFKENMVHIERDIDYAWSRAQEGALKTNSSDRYVPVPKELKERLLPVQGKPEEFVFHTSEGLPIPQATFKRIWYRLMLACGFVQWRANVTALRKKQFVLGFRDIDQIVKEEQKQKVELREALSLAQDAIDLPIKS